MRRPHKPAALFLLAGLGLVGLTAGCARRRPVVVAPPAVAAGPIVVAPAAVVPRPAVARRAVRRAVRR